MNFRLGEYDFMTITNRPQPLIQFIAEIGGLLAFFLGSSAITLMECCCYGASKVRREYLEREKMRRVGGVEGGEEDGGEERRVDSPPVLVSERKTNKTGSRNKGRAATQTRQSQ